MRRFFVLLVILGLVGTIVPVADAAGGGRSKRYISEEITINWSHTTTHGTTGILLSVTAQEFLADCSLPSTNGVDAYVFETPRAYRKVESTIQAFGKGSLTGHDLDIYLFDRACEVVVSYTSLNPDEIGEMPKGTAFILLHNFGFNPGGGGGPVQAHFEITPPSKDL